MSKEQEFIFTHKKLGVEVVIHAHSKDDALKQFNKLYDFIPEEPYETY